MTVNKGIARLRRKLIERSQRFLQPGEEAQTAIPAWNPRNIWLLLLYLVLPVIGWVVLLTGRYRIILVTDRRIMVLDSGRFSASNPRRVLREFPRSTRIGPVRPRGRILRTDSLGETLKIWKYHSDDITAADSWAPAGTSPSPPPPPPPPAPGVSTLPSQ